MANVSEHSFCRELLKQTMAEVRQRFTTEEIGQAWVWEGARKCFEFHGPNREYLYQLDADCKWSAAASGWMKLLELQSDQPTKISRRGDG